MKVYILSLLSLLAMLVYFGGNRDLPSTTAKLTDETGSLAPAHALQTPSLTAKETIKNLPSRKIISRTTYNTNTTMITDQVNSLASAVVKSETALKEQNVSSLPSQYTGAVSLMAITDAKSVSDESKATSSLMEININYTNGNNSLAVATSASKELSQGFEEGLNDTNLTYSRSNLYQNDNKKISAHATTVYPTSKISKVRDELIVGLSLGTTFSITNIANSRFSFSYGPRYIKNFHKYITNRTNKSLIESVISQTALLSYSFSDKLTYSSSLVYNIATTYQGTERNHTFVTSQDLSYALSDKTGLSFGINTGNELIYPERGKSKTLSIYDPKTSQFYLSVTYAI